MSGDGRPPKCLVVAGACSRSLNTCAVSLIIHGLGFSPCEPGVGVLARRPPFFFSPFFVIGVYLVKQDAGGPKQGGWIFF